MLVGLVSIALAAPLSACGETWTARGVADVVESADLSVGAMDTAGLLAARDLLLRRLACVSEPLPAATVGAVHRVVATAAFLEKQDARIAPALAGLLAADPGYQMPPTLYPEGHPMRKLLVHAGILARSTTTRPLAVLPSGWLEVDGLPTAAAPAERAAIVQQIDAQGAVVETRYVWPDDALGAWSGSGAPLPSATAKRPARVPLAVATVASVVATGVLYGLARDRHDTFWDTSAPRSDAEIEQLRDTTNGLTIGWVAAGVASVGLGVGLAVAW